MISLQGSSSPHDLGDPIDLAAGGKLILDIPLADSLKVIGYGSYDDIYGFAGGGLLNYRLPIGGSLVRAPNAVESPEADIETDSSVEMVIGRGEKAMFSPQGELIGSVEPISPQQLEQLMVENLQGQDRIPESLHYD